MRKYNVIILFILLLVSFIIVGCGGSPPKKTILDVEEGEVHQGGDPMSQRSIVDSQGNILYSKDLSQPGGILRELFIKDDNIIGSHSSIGAFIRSEGARTKGQREPSNYYPVDIEELLENNNIFNGEYWIMNDGLNNLKQLERENLRLSQIRKALNQRDKSFLVEDERICIQGGRIISNLVYYRSENSACYGKGDANCKPFFAEFPFFKSCSSLSNLKNTFEVPNEWNNYSISCNYNSNFATIPSFLKDVNIGYSHCLLKNNQDSQNSILIGYEIGNPQLENISSLDLSIENLINDFTVISSEELSSFEVIVKNKTQNSINTGQDLSLNSNSSLIITSLNGSLHSSSYQDKVSSNYMLVESTDEKIVEIKEYKVNLENNEEYYVYVDDYSSWYAISTIQLDINDFYNSYENTNQLPSRTAERLLVQKVQNDKKYTLTEESETLYYKSNHLFNIDSDNSYTTFPIYLLQIEGVEEDACENYFGNYDYNSDSLEYGDSLMCRVESSTLVAHLSEKAFSQEYSENNEIGLGYLVMRNILYPN